LMLNSKECKVAKLVFEAVVEHPSSALTTLLQTCQFPF
jgi:hypothetical protein